MDLLTSVLLFETNAILATGTETNVIMNDLKGVGALSMSNLRTEVVATSQNFFGDGRIRGGLSILTINSSTTNN
jgi:hypothetical protein